MTRSIKVNEVVKRLDELNACGGAVNWMKTQKTYAQAWRNCPRGDWLLWLCARLGVDRRELVLAACACAEVALVHVKEGDARPARAIATARAWCRGEATTKEVRDAAHAAYAADAADAHAAYAADAHAADAADAAAYAADAAAYAAHAADAAAYAAACAADAMNESLKVSANIVRRIIKRPSLQGKGEL